MTAPPQRLAIFRCLVGAFAVVYLMVRFPAFWALAGRSARDFEPVGALSWLDAPLPALLWRGLLVACLAFGVGFTAGFRFRASGPTFAVLLLVVTTYRSSWGQLLYFENLLVLHTLIVGLARSADAFTITRSGDGTLHESSSHESSSHESSSHESSSHESSTYGWPLRLAALVTVTTYVLAGFAKLRIGGLDWMLGDTLRNHIAFSAARLGVLGGRSSPLAELVVDNAWVLTPLATAVVVLELGAPIALLGGWPRNLWVAAVWMMHIGIAATMFVVFPYPISLIAFAPMFRLERLPDALRRIRWPRRDAAPESRPSMP